VLLVTDAVRFYADAFTVARAGMAVQCSVLVCAWGIVFFIYQ